MRKLLVLLPAVVVIAVLLACQMPSQAAPAAAPPASTATTATSTPPQPPASNPPQTASTDSNVPPPTAPPTNLDVARRISVADALKAIQNNRAILVDVRGEQQWEEGHAKNALHIPEQEIVSRISELPKNKLIITYCSWPQEHTSARAVLDLNAKGMKNVAALLGGYEAWHGADLPIETSK